jgi:hypothetical protein
MALEERKRISAMSIHSGMISCGAPAVSLICMQREFSTEEARERGIAIGIDWAHIDVEQFRLGLAVELEHGTRDNETNVTDDNLLATGKIAWAHLKEVSDYYSKLKTVEGE